MSVRDDKAAALLTELAASYIAREAGRTTLITPTRTDIGRDRKNATIYVSVFPTDQSENALEFLTRHKDLFRNFLKKASRLSRLPYIRFEIDYGERNRQLLDEISGTIGAIPPEEV
ncbi:MAG: ribosome-binding factor A [Candidatus Paceibacterota bacterium]